ncbi:MAG: SWIM zinc finger family protein [Armatimonadetes bacterium]|nr:SWIM zinc finger family protein [Armatimonadota bacterium]
MFWRPYVPVSERRRQASKKVARLKKAGHQVEPVSVQGRKIATTFWGDAWCKNLENYSDYSNRLPRGRTYVRNGSVIDLQIEAGRVRAMVSGSDIYEVLVTIKPLPETRWIDIKQRCAGQIGSLVELLKGSISKGVMEVVTGREKGLFPAPGDISLSCSCPDWASMCKHVAAVLYGVGARLDHRPELLFTLRGVDPTEMVEAAVKHAPTTGRSRTSRVLDSGDLSSVFGIDIAGAGDAPSPKTKSPRKTTSAKATARKGPSGKARSKKPTATAVEAPKAAPRRAATKKVDAGKPGAKKPASGKAPRSRGAGHAAEDHTIVACEKKTLRSLKVEGQVTTGTVMERFGLPRARAKAMLERMAERGALRRVGERGRGVHYVIA